MAATSAAAIGGAVAGFVIMAVLDPAQRSTQWDVWVILATAVVTTGIAYHLTRD